MSHPIDVMFHVTTRASLSIVQGLCAAAQRRGCSWVMFLTNDAVTLALESRLQAAVHTAERIVVCESSWEQFVAEQDCPFEKGSQTNNSEMISFAKRVVSL